MTGTVQNVSVNIYSKYQYQAKKTVDPEFVNRIKDSGSKADKSESQRGKVMADYYARKPQYKSVQEGRVKGGYSVLSASGISAEDIEDMSMDEFKNVISGIIGAIPHHATRPYDEETVLISSEGWENMKKDPDYAAWVLGYLKEDRSVSNPFFGMGDKGSFCVQSFGASPAEYHGQGFSKIYGGTAAGARSMYNSAAQGGGIVTKAPQADLQPPADYNLWEERRKARRKKQQELIDADIQDKYLQKKHLDEMYEKRYFEHQRIMGTFNSAKGIESFGNSKRISESISSVIAQYESSFMMTGAEGSI